MFFFEGRLTRRMSIGSNVISSGWICKIFGKMKMLKKQASKNISNIIYDSKRWKKSVQLLLLESKLSKVQFLPNFTPASWNAQMAHFKLYRTSTMCEYAAHVFNRSAYFATVSVVGCLNCMRFWIIDSWITQPTSWFYKNTIVSVVIGFFTFSNKAFTSNSCLCFLVW